jgi:hypothetical protein
MLPRGRYVEFDIEDYLGENDMGAPADRSAPDPEDSPE